MDKNSISTSLAILSAMITPAVLVLATGSLILTTSQRLSRSLERTRKIYGEFEVVYQKELNNSLIKEKITMLERQLTRITRRSQILQFTMTVLHITLGIFISTSISIGIVALFGLHYAWIPTSLGMVGTFTFLYSSVLLISESKIAIQSVKDEMKYAMDISSEVKTRVVKT